MGKLLGPLHQESYVHVHDVRDDAYGFGGLTQGRRYVERQLSTVKSFAA
jgi:4-oxalocrotonate tautomerase